MLLQALQLSGDVNFLNVLENQRDQLVTEHEGLIWRPGRREYLLLVLLVQPLGKRGVRLHMLSADVV